MKLPHSTHRVLRMPGPTPHFTRSHKFHNFSILNHQIQIIPTREKIILLNFKFINPEKTARHENIFCIFFCISFSYFFIMNSAVLINFSFLDFFASHKASSSLPSFKFTVALRKNAFSRTPACALLPPGRRSKISIVRVVFLMMI